MRCVLSLSEGSLDAYLRCGRRRRFAQLLVATTRPFRSFVWDGGRASAGPHDSDDGSWTDDKRNRRPDEKTQRGSITK